MTFHQKLIVQAPRDTPKSTDIHIHSDQVWAERFDETGWDENVVHDWKARSIVINALSFLVEKQLSRLEVKKVDDWIEIDEYDQRGEIRSMTIWPREVELAWISDHRSRWSISVMNIDKVED